jgi:hypothetical protein
MSERFHAKHSPLSAWEGKLLRKTTGCEEEEAALSVIGFAGCEGRHSRPLFETCQLPADFLHAPKPSGGAAKHRINSVPVALPRECRSKPGAIPQQLPEKQRSKNGRRWKEWVAKGVEQIPSRSTARR